MKTTIRIALNWAIRSFGRDHVFDTRIRALRVAEEAVELAQAAWVEEAQMHKLVGLVYSRPPGEVLLEVGGVLMTTYILAARLGYDPKDIFADELLRVLQKTPEYYGKRNQEKIELGLD
jgi:hypothetical protein